MSKWGSEGDKWCPENDFAWQKEQAVLNKRVCQGGVIRCMDCRCGRPSVEGERSERWSDYG